jgi:hypothetical protein
MKTLCLIGLIAAATTATTVTAGVTDCDTASVFRPTQLGISPTAPAPGDAVTLTVVFNNPGPEISDGQVTTTLVLNGLPFSPTKQPLCENTQCPITVGENNRTTTSTWPDVSGNVRSRITWKSAEGVSLLCLDMNVKTAVAPPTETFFDVIRKSLRGGAHRHSGEEEESWKFAEGVTSDDTTSSSEATGSSTNFLRNYRKNVRPF